jgi:hypothetical protein
MQMMNAKNVLIEATKLFSETLANEWGAQRLVCFLFEDVSRSIQMR